MSFATRSFQKTKCTLARERSPSREECAFSSPVFDFPYSSQALSTSPKLGLTGSGCPTSASSPRRETSIQPSASVMLASPRTRARSHPTSLYQQKNNLSPFLRNQPRPAPLRILFSSLSGCRAAVSHYSCSALQQSDGS